MELTDKKTVNFQPKISFYKAFLIFSIPLLQYFYLRGYLHSVLKMQIGFVGMTDYDLLFSGALSFFVLFFALEKNQKLIIKFKLPAFLLNIILFGSFIWLSSQNTGLFQTEDTFYKVLWFSLATLVLVAAFFWFITPAQVFKHPLRFLLLPAALMAFSKIIFRHGFDSLWEPMALTTGKITYNALKLFMPDLQYVLFVSDAGDKFAQIKHPVYTVAVGSGCSGMEGISIFVFTMLMVYCWVPKRYTKVNWFLLFLLGIFWMFTLNVIRIGIFYSISFLALKNWGHDTGITVALNLFHNSVGWILYTVGIYVFYQTVMKFFEKSFWNKKARMYSSQPSYT